jgi:Ni,Fe-hydrogenase III large subunit
MTPMATSSIAALLAGRDPVPGHKPWPRYEVDAAAWDALGEALGRGAIAGEATLLGMWGEGGAAHMGLNAAGLGAPCIVSLRITAGAFPSIGRHHPAAIRLERAICDLYGFVATGAPDTRHWLDHGAWGLRAPLGAKIATERSDPAGYEFLAVRGEGLHQIPVGPVHAGIIEPGHFRFTANGEIVARLEARLGYTHKGIDGLLTDCELDKAARVVARVSGDSTVALGFGFARAVEAALDIAVPARAQVLRGVMAELERIANHIGDIGAICNDAAFALLLAYGGILREAVLAACDRAFGHRLMMDMIVPGGVARDITAEGVQAILALVDDFAPRFAEIVENYDDTPSLQDRTCLTGIVSPDLVARWGAGGHVGRASGRDFDARRDVAYPPYVGMTFRVPVLARGDVDARVRVRIAEVEASLALLKTWLAALPEGPVRVPVPPAAAPREGVAMIEAFRGDLLVWLRLAGKHVARAHVRDASWFQWPLLEAAVENNIVADFPLCNKSFNCSYSGHDL